MLNTGEHVLIVEDVLTTGGQVLEAAKTLMDMGAKIEREMRRAEKVQKKQLKADVEDIERDAKSAGAAANG